MMHIGMAHTGMACIRVAYTGMAYIRIAHTGMPQKKDATVNRVRKMPFAYRDGRNLEG